MLFEVQPVAFALHADELPRHESRDEEAATEYDGSALEIA